MTMLKLNGEVVEPVSTTITYASGKLQDIIDGFVNSGERVVKLATEKGEYASMSSARSAVTSTIRSQRRNGYIKVKQANGSLFLLNELK